MTEETLSDKIEEMREEDIEEYDLTERESKILYVEDVKDFIRKLKEDIRIMKFFNSYGDLVTNNILNHIDKLAGMELIKWQHQQI